MSTQTPVRRAAIALKHCTVIRAHFSHVGFRELREMGFADVTPVNKPGFPIGTVDFRLTDSGRELVVGL